MDQQHYQLDPLRIQTSSFNDQLEKKLSLPLYPAIVVAFQKDAAHFHRDAAVGGTLDDKERLKNVRSFEGSMESKNKSTTIMYL